MEKQKQNKALDTVTDKVQEKEMKGDQVHIEQLLNIQAVGNLSSSSQEKPKIKPSDADLKLFKAKFVIFVL